MGLSKKSLRAHREYVRCVVLSKVEWVGGIKTNLMGMTRASQLSQPRRHFSASLFRDSSVCSGASSDCSSASTLTTSEIEQFVNNQVVSHQLMSLALEELFKSFQAYLGIAALSALDMAAF